ncbi:MAG: NTP transferase domain-containing protein [Dehalococcoidia bacterium]|nr:NTP transferase domain-containing protein [Dehalococcoidia bacterium]
MNATPAIILAGGKGKRMGILCRKKPKPVLSFGGGYRIIDFTLSNCIYSHISKIAVMVDYEQKIMTRYLKRWHAVNNRPCSMHVLPPASGYYKGTADAVYQNLEYINGLDSESILLLAGDHVYNMDYGRMLEFHNDVQADATIGVVRIVRQEAHRFGTVIVDGLERVLQFKEKSADAQSNIASMGIYVFNKNFLVEWLNEDARRKDSFHDFGYSLLPYMVDSAKVFAYEFDGYWADIGTVNSYYDSHMELLAPMPHFRVEESRPVLTAGQKLPMYKIIRQDNIVNSIISPGCVVKGHVINSVLSAGVIVEEQAEVIDSVVLSNSTIGFHSVINRSILDENVKVGKYCHVGLELDRSAEAMDITVLGQNVEMPDYVAVGSRSKVLPDAVAADFKSRFIQPDTVIEAMTQ